MAIAPMGTQPPIDAPCRPLRRLKSAFIGACAPGVGLRRHRCKECLFRSAQVDRWPQAFTSIEIGLHRRFAPSVGLRRRKEPLLGRRRSTAGRRPSEVGFIRHAPRRASASANAKDAFFGWRMPTVGRRPSKAGFIRRAPPEGPGTFRGSPLLAGTRGSPGGACPGRRSPRRRAPRDSGPGDEGAPAGPSTWPPPPAGRNTRRSLW
jgi:hypothetical protein